MCHSHHCGSSLGITTGAEDVSHQPQASEQVWGIGFTNSVCVRVCLCVLCSYICRQAGLCVLLRWKISSMYIRTYLHLYICAFSTWTMKNIWHRLHTVIAVFICSVRSDTACGEFSGGSRLWQTATNQLPHNDSISISLPQPTHVLICLRDRLGFFSFRRPTLLTRVCYWFWTKLWSLTVKLDLIY